MTDTDTVTGTPVKSNMPQPKVMAAAIGGALTSIIVWVVGQFDVFIPGDVGAAIATLIGFAFAYFAPDRAQRITIAAVRSIAAFLTPLVVAGLVLGAGLGACNTFEPVQTAETPRQQAYALFGTFVIYEEAAANIAERPGTPRAVIDAIQAAHRVALPAAESVFIAMSRYGELQDQARILEASGLAPEQDLLDDMLRALTALTDTLRVQQPKIEQFFETVNENASESAAGSAESGLAAGNAPFWPVLVYIHPGTARNFHVR